MFYLSLFQESKKRSLTRWVPIGGGYFVWRMWQFRVLAGLLLGGMCVWTQCLCQARDLAKPHLRMKRKAIAPAPVESPHLELLTLDAFRFRVRLQGQPETLYGAETSTNLEIWVNDSTRWTDGHGLADWEYSLEGGPRFVRVRAASTSGELDPAEVALGERLFLETRFAQFFAVHRPDPGSVNQPLDLGDPALEELRTVTGGVPGPFRGQSMNCRACHLVDENPSALGFRTYGDFAARSPIPDRGDGRLLTPRNSPPLVNAFLPREVGFFLHSDGEFPDSPALVRGTFTGRNFGWLPGEARDAIANLGRVLREDDGSMELSAAFGGSYARILAGLDPEIPVEFRLAKDQRVRVETFTDEELLVRVSEWVAQYLEQLEFRRNADGVFEGSPYDVFLQKNHLPQQPEPGESSRSYADRLLRKLQSAASWDWVDSSDRTFELHTQPFHFGPTELRGLIAFLTTPENAGHTPASRAIGNCVACHAPPAFTDFSFHNTGVSQQEYDAVHGPGRFAELVIPSWEERALHPLLYLPPSAVYPSASGRFLSIPTLEAPEHADLGLWNVFGNPAVPGPQTALRDLLKARFGNRTDAEWLDLTVAAFKTPGLRDLVDSAPYFHTGQFVSLETVVEFYRSTAIRARLGEVRNVDPELLGMEMDSITAEAIVRFLLSLTEDYD